LNNDTLIPVLAWILRFKWCHFKRVCN